MKVAAKISASILFALSAAAAPAQSFTYSTVDNAPTVVGGPDMRGTPAIGMYWTGTSTVTWADGRKTVDKYTCVSTSQPANDKIFDTHSVCDATSAEGTYSAVFGCQFLSKDMQSTGCVGGLTGRTGRYAGMGGAITFSGRSGAGTGTGAWSKPAE